MPISLRDWEGSYSDRAEGIGEDRKSLKAELEDEFSVMDWLTSGKPYGKALSDLGRERYDPDTFTGQATQDKAGKLGMSVKEFTKKLKAGDAELLSALGIGTGVINSLMADDSGEGFD